MNTTVHGPTLKDAIGHMRDRLEKARSQFNVDVFAFYIGNDPFLPSFLRCVASSGADFEEATSHFCLKPVPDERNFRFVRDARTDPLRAGDGDLAIRLLQVDRARNLVFGDFVTRERIASRAWFAHRDTVQSPPEAILTVNYRDERDEREWYQRDQAPLQALFNDLVAQLEPIERCLKDLYYPLAWELMPIVNLALPTDLGKRRPLESCERKLERILTGAAEALCHVLSETLPDKWCGTIYLLDVSRRRLHLKAQTGRSHLPPHDLDLETGEGVISWVAVREQAVRIRDLEASPMFKALHRDFQTDIRSQMAVPMIHNGQVLGVLSLESPDPNVYRRSSMGFLTRVASLAAAVIVHSEIEQERDLYLEAVYASKRAEVLAQPLPSFEELVRATTNPLKFDF